MSTSKENSKKTNIQNNRCACCFCNLAQIDPKTMRRPSEIKKIEKLNKVRVILYPKNQDQIETGDFICPNCYNKSNRIESLRSFKDAETQADSLEINPLNFINPTYIISNELDQSFNVNIEIPEINLDPGSTLLRLLGINVSEDDSEDEDYTEYIESFEDV